MKIWVDADACPNAVKEILFRAALRTNTLLVLVANNIIYTPRSPLISSIRVEQGFDVADNYIVKHIETNDLVITADIPLAAEIVAKKCLALNPRGELYTVDNVRQRLGVRDMMEQLRSGGAQLGGPAAFGAKEKIAFANALDRILAKSK